VEIQVLARRGETIRGIARQLGISRNTVRSVLREDSMRRQYGPRDARPTKLEAYKPYLLQRIEHAKPRWIPAPVLMREILERGYGGGLTQLKIWLADQRPVKDDPVVRFETAPGKQMQADFTVIRRGANPLLALVCTLGHSRATFVRFSHDETADTLCAGLREAFDYFGGVTEHVLFDNAKTVVIERNRYGEGRHHWHAKLKEIADECGFIPRACRPYRAKTKGKVHWPSASPPAARRNCSSDNH
jgi:transposase